jgi:hypothetical protein
MLLSVSARLPGTGISCFLKLPEQQLHHPFQLPRGDIYKAIDHNMDQECHWREEGTRYILENKTPENYTNRQLVECQVRCDFDEVTENRNKHIMAVGIPGDGNRHISRGIHGSVNIRAAKD